MRYINKKNGFIVETNCIVSGENWEKMKDKEEVVEKKADSKKKSKE